MIGLDKVSPNTAEILERLARNAKECACNNECLNTDIIPFEEHRPTCNAVIDMKKQRLQAAGVGVRIINTLLYGLQETYALKLIKTYMQGSFKSGALLVLAGGVGTGKTVAASYVIGEVGGMSVYSGDLQQVFLSDRFDVLKTVNFSLIDDLGTEHRKDFFESNLDAFIHYRHANILPTIITTNLKHEEFKEAYKGRIASRIREWGYFVNVIAKDMREKEGSRQ